MVEEVAAEMNIIRRESCSANQIGVVIQDVYCILLEKYQLHS